MSKPAAATDSRCRLFPGAFHVALAALSFFPCAVLAAEAGPALRSSDQVDLRRLGKVSEDERSVLRMEWRAGLAGAEETRSVEDMLDKLRRLETGIGEVSQLIRNMPAQAPAVAAAVPVAAEAPDTDGYDLRLMVANFAALALVALWWFRRRKPAVQPAAGPAPSLKDAQPGAVPITPTPPVALPLATAALTGIPPAEMPLTATQESAAFTPAKTGDNDAPPSEPVAASDAPGATLDPDRLSSAEPVVAASINPPEPKPSEPLTADQTMIFDFSLEEADPEVLARENARLQASLPASAPEPPPTPPVEAPQEDIEPTLQLAEIMLSMGLEQGAAQALIEYTEAHPRHAIYHWLKLLGIYRSRGLQKEFATTAEKLRMYFNIQAAEWGTPATSEAPTLENFSRVAEHVQKIWAQPEECTAYLRRLLEDNRDGARAGFPQSVAEEILLLVELQKELAGLNQPAA